MKRVGHWIILTIVALCSCDQAEQERTPTEQNAEQPVAEVEPQPLTEAPPAEAPLAEDLEEAKKEKSVTRARPRAFSPGKLGSGGGARSKMPAAPPPTHNTEEYAHVEPNGFQFVRSEPLSTFSIDTDTASYSNVRRLLQQGQRPPRGAVRVEELINYFTYSYPNPEGPHPFSANVEAAECPWNQDHQLVRIGLKGQMPPPGQRKPANLVFLLDVSGSMNAPNKLPLLQRSLAFAVNQLQAKDRVAIVVYAGASGLVLPSTPFSDRTKILDALHALEAGGSTNGGEGIELAYDVARQHFIPGGINRVILATDGDFNVGVTSQSSLVDLVKQKAKGGVFLTVLGFGMSNLKDATLEKLADNGNGSYAYIDDFDEARKVFGTQIGGTLETIAQDVKIQVEFNPAKVSAYRLIGYENRRLTSQDFRDDKKDAGEIGAGHTVTAFYQIVPVGRAVGDGVSPPGPLKYQPNVSQETASDEWMTVKVRYKRPAENRSIEAAFPVRTDPVPFANASPDFRFAASVAGFGMLLAESPHRGNLSFDRVLEWARTSQGSDPHGHRAQFVGLVSLAQSPKVLRVGGSTSDCGCAPSDPLCSCF